MRLWWPVRRPWNARLLLLFLVWAAFALRLYRLGSQDFWGDEAASYAFAVLPPGEMLLELADHEPHPPLYYAALHFWMPLAGKSEYALRFLSLAAGVVLLPLLFHFGRRLGGPSLGLAAVLIAVVNPFQVWYAQETRQYMPAAAFSLAATLLFMDLRERPSRRLALGYVLMTLLAIGTHYYSLFVLLAHHIVFWLRRRRERGLTGQWLGAQGLIVLAYLPWVVLASRIFLSYRKERPGEIDLWAILGSFWARGVAGWSLNKALLPWVGAVVTLCILLGLWRLWRRGGILVLLYLLVPILGGLLFSLFRPVFQERYLFVVTPPYLLLLAAGLLQALRLPPVAFLSAAFLGSLSLFSLNNLYHHPAYLKGEYETLVREIEAMALPGDAVVLNGISQWFLYDYYRTRPLPVHFVPGEVPLVPSAVERQLAEIQQRRQGIWLLVVGTDEYDPERFVYRWLNQHFYRTPCRWSASGMLCYYRVPGAAPSPVAQATADFGTWQLEATLLEGATVEAGHSLGLELQWVTRERLPRDYKVFLHLRDTGGDLWGQHDTEPLGGLRPTSTFGENERVVERIGVRADPALPPGEYKLVLGVYERERGEPLAFRDPTRDSPATELSLGKILVEPSMTPFPEAAFRFATASGATFGQGLRLLGYDLPPKTQAGTEALLRTYWRAQEAQREEYEAEFALWDGARGQRHSLGAHPLSIAPIQAWRPGQVVAARYHLHVPPRARAGDYRLEMRLRTFQGQEVLPLPGAAASSWLALGTVRVESRARVMKLPKPQHTLAQDLGEFARLLGYDLKREEGPPARLRLTLYWQATGETATAYTVFTHLLDERGLLAAQHDGPPAAGGAPTTSWLPGEVVTDLHVMLLPEGLPASSYRIAVGLYDPASGLRLRTPPGKDHVLLPSLNLP